VHHWAVGDEISIERFQEQLQNLLDVYLQQCGTSYTELKATSKIIYTLTDVTRTSNEQNIELIPNGETEEERRTSVSRFNSLVTWELCLRKLSIFGSLEEQKRRLMNFLTTEFLIDWIS